ncbi:hypothetical protein BGW38_000329 [Lunasporangiospora selenospora]|uniref:Uncharacterized protein n=1 Tax=Lunasporangiospora selenospora TaxID=979761 RepID=A0A9P6FX71_9FUNG|nr:hypothetical protein BGW38_000329 [Lunasporangiospora selenospora]
MSAGRLAALEDASQRLAAVDFATPRLYTSLLLENQAIPVRNAKPVEQSLIMANGGEFLKNIKTKEGADEFEATMELATTLNEICQRKDVHSRLEEISQAHTDVLASIRQLSTELTELEGANATSDSQDTPQEENDEISKDILREEGEIFALEQLLGERRELVNQMEKELEELVDMVEKRSSAPTGGSNDAVMEEADGASETEVAAKRLDMEYLDQKIRDQKREETEQIQLYQNLLRERDGLAVLQQEESVVTAESPSSYFEEIAQLWQRASSQDGEETVEILGAKDVYLKLERLLDGLERSQNLIVLLDVIEQIITTLIDNCADPNAQELDPPRSMTVRLLAKGLQLIVAAGGRISLTEFKDKMVQAAEELGGPSASSLGLQVVYRLVAGFLIHIDRSTNPNIVSFT